MTHDSAHHLHALLSAGAGLAYFFGFGCLRRVVDNPTRTTVAAWGRWLGRTGALMILSSVAIDLPGWLVR